MKKYIPAAFFTVLILLLLFLRVKADTSTIDLSSVATLTSSARNLSGGGQLLYMNNGVIDVLPGSFATTSPISNINFGQYAGYPNPSGMLNLYSEATGTPILSSSFMGKTSSYVQVYGQNLDPAGSFDVVMADDKGTATSTTHYADLGIANSTQNDSTYSLIQPLDAYLYSSTGRVLIGSGASNASSTVIISPGMATTSPRFQIDQYGHVITYGAKPALSGCTGGSLSGQSNSAEGTITVTGLLSLTSCVVTFTSTPYPTGSEVHCTINNKNNATVGGYTTTITTITMPVSIGIGGGSFTYQCQASVALPSL